MTEVSQDVAPLAADNDDLIPVPSGQAIMLQDVISDAPGPEGTALRFRFLAPAIARDGGTVDFDAAISDMLHLCQNFALPRVTESAPRPGQIIISLADRPIPFGEAAPEATQFFESFRIEDDGCIWEPY